MTTVRSSDLTASISSSHDEAPSWKSRVLDHVLRLLPHKRRLASAAAVRTRVKQLTSKPPSFEPTALGRDVEVKVEKRAGWPVYRVYSAMQPDVRNYAVFLHGGAYIEEIVRPHWQLVGHLAREAPAQCIVPIFPLAPHSKAQDTVPAMGALLGELLQEFGAGNVTVIGNSSGAGLAIAAAQWLRDQELPQPKALLLISPWVDASVSRAEQAETAPHDPVLAIPGLIEAGRLYAGDLDTSHPFVSPLKGEFRHLAPLTIFAGTRDLLFSDSVELARKASQSGVRVELHKRRDLPHNYPLLPTPEGREARAIIARMIGAEA